MNHIKLLFFILFFISCEKVLSQDTVIIGKATNLKAGGIVLTKNKLTYYIDGLDFWDFKIIGKKVRVKGTVKLVKYTKPENQDNGIQVQEIIGDYRIILNPKWELVKTIIVKLKK